MSVVWLVAPIVAIAAPSGKGISPWQLGIMPWALVRSIEGLPLSAGMPRMLALTMVVAGSLIVIVLTGAAGIVVSGLLGVHPASRRNGVRSPVGRVRASASDRQPDRP